MIGEFVFRIFTTSRDLLDLVCLGLQCLEWVDVALRRVLYMQSPQKEAWAPLDIWGGGGGTRVFVACKLFFYLREKTIFFFGYQRPPIFLYVSAKKCFVVCSPYYVCYHLGFFSGQHIFHQFRQQTFFSALIFHILFSTFVATNSFFNFFLAPPPPRYQMLRP